MKEKELAVAEKKKTILKEIEELTYKINFYEEDTKKRKGELIETTIKGFYDVIFSFKALIISTILLILRGYEILPATDVYMYMMFVEAVFFIINMPRYDDHRYNEEEFWSMLVDGDISFYFMLRKDLKKDKKMLEELKEKLELLDFQEEKKTNVLNENAVTTKFDDVVLIKANNLSNKCNEFSNDKKEIYLKDISKIVCQYRDECIEIVKGDKDNKEELLSLLELRTSKKLDIISLSIEKELVVLYQVRDINKKFNEYNETVNTSIDNDMQLKRTK